MFPHKRKFPHLKYLHFGATTKPTEFMFEKTTRKPVGFMQSCCFVLNGNETDMFIV